MGGAVHNYDNGVVPFSKTGHSPTFSQSSCPSKLAADTYEAQDSSRPALTETPSTSRLSCAILRVESPTINHRYPCPRCLRKCLQRGERRQHAQARSKHGRGWLYAQQGTAFFPTYNTYVQCRRTLASAGPGYRDSTH